MRHFIFGLFLIFVSLKLSAQDWVKDTDFVSQQHQIQVDKLIKIFAEEPSFELAYQIQQLGDWEFIYSLLEESILNKSDKELLAAYQAWYENDFDLSKSILKQVLTVESKRKEALRLKAILQIEAWDLERAELLAKDILSKHPQDFETEAVLGRSLVLQQKYNRALELANQRIENHPNLAWGYALKADVYFWDQKPEKAESYLEKALQLNPFDADRRFFYGYAIWRRIDATQLDDMMAQWELAILFNPLHFQTHWHIGNGHTNLSFVDYADPNETEIRKELEAADEAFTQAKMHVALQIIESVKKKYPESVLADMHKASLLYSDFDAKNRKELLDEAENIFLSILERKKHYGPAHNGLAAVIKSKRIPFLKDYEAQKEAMLAQEIPADADLESIFPDVSYYPGNLGPAMVWSQLYTSKAYLPFLAKLKREFVIPPLHIDLAIAMNNSYFRNNTTFDNRQWMDIRGVGSGAAGIGYVERGAFGERNVLLHEYVHLFHIMVLTDQQNRDIRSLYYNAMQNNLTLDYYSQNNESEYLAQTYPAYFEAEKVHPLDFKSMNNTSDLKNKDPKMYAFLDELVAKEKAYLKGDTTALASNWSQVYLNLAKAAKTDTEKLDLLRTASLYDKDYLPVILEKSKFYIAKSDFKEAQKFIEQALEIDKTYAPIYATQASLLKKQNPKAVSKQMDLQRKAYDLETDFMEKARQARALRNMYYHYGEWDKAIALAEEYVQNAEVVSTYLRDAKEEFEAFAAWQYGLRGDKKQKQVLANLVAQRPFNYQMQLYYADVLMTQNENQKALDVILPSHLNFEAAKVDRLDFMLKIAQINQKMDDETALQEILNKIEQLDKSKWSYLENLSYLDLKIAEQSEIPLPPKDASAEEKMSYYYSFGLLAAEKKSYKKALKHYKKAAKINAYAPKLHTAIKDLAEVYRPARSFYNKL